MIRLGKLALAGVILAVVLRWMATPWIEHLRPDMVSGMFLAMLVAWGVGMICVAISLSDDDDQRRKYGRHID